MALYGAMLAWTVAWSLWEVGWDGWQLVPRLVAPFVLSACYGAPPCAEHDIVDADGESQSSQCRPYGCGFGLLLLQLHRGAPGS